MSRPPAQLDLFASRPSLPEDARQEAMPSRGVRPAPVPEHLQLVAAQLPADIRIGTSSWSFPAWAGLVYDAEVSKARLARDGLAAYARHPLLRSVGIDRSYYAPLTTDTFAAYADVVPTEFRFLVKAHELCTIDRFPRHARYGAQGGTRNRLFLDASYTADVVVRPFVEGLGPKAGPLLFQFPPQDVAALGGAERFAERLCGFLGALPVGPLYAVEMRNAELLTPTYVQALVTTGACHCLSAHPALPPIAAQIRLTRAALTRAMVIRWMLRRGLAYDEARDLYRPFNRIVDEDPATRDAIATGCVAAAATHRPAFVIINNKAEGSAPLTAFRLAEDIAGRLAGSAPVG
jgi:uncharacterized protein YecE (DUF72 family)